MDANGSDLAKLSGKLIEAVQKFRKENERYGYGTVQVNAFLDELIDLAGYYVGAGGQESAGKANLEAIRQEYIKLAMSITQGINDAKFTQGFRGYDVVQVDDYLDHIIRYLDKYPEEGAERLDAEVIKNTGFGVGFRGYDYNEVNNFMDDLAAAIAGLNNIKDKYLGGGR